MNNQLTRLISGLGHLSRVVVKRVLRKEHLKYVINSSAIGLLLLSIGVAAQLANRIISIENIQIKKTGVSIANLQLNAPSLAVGQSISATYEFIDYFSGDPRDASVYLWGVKGSTAAQVNSTGQVINQTGIVPHRMLLSADIGSVLEVSVQARNASGKKGNTLTVATDSSGSGQGGAIYDGSIAPSVSNLIMNGVLNVGQALNAAYQYNANGGNVVDKTTYLFGYKGHTVANVSNGASVNSSGQIPNYTIKASDAGQVLELSIQAKNAAVPARTGNTLTIATDGSGGGGTNNTTGGGGGGSIINPTAPPSVNNLSLSGVIQVGSTLHASYNFNANSGEPTDKTTYKWGPQDTTASQVGVGSNIITSGIVPGYTIQSSDIGQILEVSIQAKNNSAIIGNILTAVAQEAVPTEPTELSASGSTLGVSVGQTSVNLTAATASGGKTPYTYSVSSADQTALAANGLTLNTANGTLTATTVSGSAAAATNYTVTVTDANGVTKTATMNLTVSGALSASGSTLGVSVGQTSVNLTAATASGGKAPYTYSVSSADQTALAANGLTLNTANGTLTATTVSGSAAAATNYTVTVTDANGATKTATMNLTINKFPNTITLGSACSAGTIGACGTLRNPVTVSDRTYYCWDMDNDGNCGNGAGDYRTHDVLDSFFNKDVNGVSCGSGNTTDSCRYVNAAQAGGHQLALIPAGVTAGGGNTACTGIPSTSDSLCGIRAASGNTNPSGWTSTYYWSSTGSSSGHYFVTLSSGNVLDIVDSNSYYVAVQVF